MMKSTINWIKKIRIQSIAIFLTSLLFFVGLLFVDHASAQVAQNIINQTQSSFEKALQDTNQVISDLPQELERVTSEPQIAVRKQIEDDLENRQDSLENLADSVDDLAEKLQSYNKKSLSSDPQFQKNALNIQQSLENVAQTIDSLANDVENAKEGSPPTLRTQIEQKIEAVSQALENANSAFQAINQNPV